MSPLNLKTELVKYFAITFGLAAAIAITGCDDSVTGSDEPPPTMTLIEDIDANGVDGHFTFLNLEDSTIVPLADSNSTAWDLAFKQTTVLLNSGESGPGTTRAALLEAAFDEVADVPANLSLREDGGPDDPAIPTGSDEGWYHYSGPPSHLITPIPGRVIIVQTNEGNYAKLRVLSYYRGNPAEAGSTDSRYYTIEYVLASDGTHSFE